MDSSLPPVPPLPLALAFPGQPVQPVQPPNLNTSDPPSSTHAQNQPKPKKKYPDLLGKKPTTSSSSSSSSRPAGPVGLGLRTDSGNDFFARHEAGEGLRRRGGRECEQAETGGKDGQGLESLEHLLTRAGYKETRICTPEKRTTGGTTTTATTTTAAARPRLDVRLLTRRVELRAAEALGRGKEEVQREREGGSDKVQGPLPSAVQVQVEDGQGQGQGQGEPLPAQSNISSQSEPPKTLPRKYKEDQIDREKRIFSAPALVPTIGARKRPDHTSNSPRPGGTGAMRAATSGSHQGAQFVPREAAGKIEGLSWADIEDSIEEESPVQDTPSPAMRYKAVRLPPVETVPRGGEGAETFFGKREDGTLFYPTLSGPGSGVERAPEVPPPPVRGYPGQPGGRMGVTPSYPSTGYVVPPASATIGGNQFPNPHMHQYRPQHPVSILPPSMDAFTLRKMRSEADIKIREMERRAEAEEMSRGWKELDLEHPVPPLPASSVISTDGTEMDGQRKRKVLNRVELEFRSVHTDEISESDLDTNGDEAECVTLDSSEVDVYVRDTREGSIKAPDTGILSNGGTSIGDQQYEIEIEDRFDPSAYEDGEDLDVEDVAGVYSSDEDYTLTITKRDEIEIAEELVLSASYESQAVMESHMLEDESARLEPLLEAMTTPKKAITSIPSATETMDSPASFTSQGSRTSIVRERKLRHAMSTPLLGSSAFANEHCAELTVSNMQKWSATGLGLGAPSVPAVPHINSTWLSKLGDRVWSVGTSVMSNTSKDDHCVPSRSARPAMPRAITDLMTAQKLPVSPKVVRAGAVICDSVQSEDLPPVPVPSDEPGLPFRALRTKLSLQMLGKSGEDQTASSSDKSLTLKPRLDWHDQEAQWSAPKTTFNAATTTPKKVYKWTTNIDEVEPFEDNHDLDYTRSFFYKPPTPPKRPGSEASSSSTSTTSRTFQRQSSIKSLRAHLLKGVISAKNLAGGRSKDTIPPVPPIPVGYRSGPPPPVFAISSPGAVDAGLPPKELVLEGEEWEGGSYESRKEEAKKLKKLKRKGSLRR
jgi:hypothetical protein